MILHTLDIISSVVIGFIGVISVCRPEWIAASAVGLWVLFMHDTRSWTA